MKKILLVFGTRPEAIKMYPIIKECQKQKQLQIIVCVTGQHRDMLDQVLKCFNIKPKYDLNVMQSNQTLKTITENILGKFTLVLQKEKPNLVLVHGDTTTAFSAALASFYMQIPIGHIEAGLRTHKLTPYPEEFNRVSIDHMSKYCFAPTTTAVNNLLLEGIEKSSIYLTGNTVVDTLKYTIEKVYSNPVLDWAAGSKLILLTTHRRENIGQPMKLLFNSIKKILAFFPDVKIIYPIHPNPKIVEIVKKELPSCDKLKIIEPMDVYNFHNTLARVDLVLTDSGGIQEEAISLGKPVIVLRDNTERTESIQLGCAQLIGSNQQKLLETVDKLLKKCNYKRNCNWEQSPYGDGYASERIVDILLERIPKILENKSI